MKTSLFLFFGLLLIVGSGCIEPGGGGAGYQYLGRIHYIHYEFLSLDNSWVTTIMIDQDTFTVNGKVQIYKMGSFCAYVWVNSSKNTIRIRHRRVTSEHPILEWKH